MECRDGRRKRRTVGLAGCELALSRNATEGENDNSGQNTEHHDDDEKFDQGETVDLPGVLTALQPLVGRNHILTPLFPRGRTDTRDSHFLTDLYISNLSLIH